MNPDEPTLSLSKGRRRAATAILAALALAAPGCGGEDEAAAPARRGAASSPAELTRLSNQILGGGEKAFKRQVEALRGHAVVVNKWASWCGPCRLEFPFFVRLARKHRKIAFLGVNSLDSREDARRFLKELPVPYPSFFDPKGKVAEVFQGQRVFPTTAFYDSEGELAFTKQGPYTSEAALAKDIRQYGKEAPRVPAG